MAPDLLDKSQRRIGSMFNKIAHVYDFLNHFLSAGMDFYWRRVATRALSRAIGDGSSVVLDVATGTGDLGISLLNGGGNLRVIGVDIAGKMLRGARRKIEAKGLKSRFSIVMGDALNLPFVEDSFNGVMVAYGIRNFPDIRQALYEFSRVLKKKGYVLILEFSLPEIPFFREVYLFYFQKVLPWLGRVISGDSEAYRYLPASVENFISPFDMQAYLKQAGFSVLKIKPFLWGVSYFVLARHQGK